MLVTLAGSGAYERGYAYFLDGHVTAIESSKGHTIATVSGTRPYQVILRHADNRLDGACECPASEGIDFCKHCVATVLVLREHQVSGILREPSNEAAMLKAYLVGQGPEVLASEIMSVLPKDPVMHERLLIQAELAAGSISTKRLKKAITQVTRSQHLWEYGKVAEYFRRIEATLQNIASIADQVPAEVLLETALHGIKRLNRALEEIDDSGGYRFGAQADLRELHIRALGRTDWSPERRAAHVLELALADEWDQFEGVPHDYAEVLGKKGLEAFYAGVQRLLAAQPKLSSDADFAEKYPHLRLTHYLRQRAEEQEDWETLINLQQLTATSALDYERMAVLYLRKGDPSGAAEWLTKADTSGDKNRHGRSSVGVGGLVANQPVEIEGIFLIRD